jgi:2-methylcitrate dehydratase PrpD
MSASVLEAGLAHGRRVCGSPDARALGVVQAMILDTVGCLVGSAPSRMGQVLARQVAAFPTGDLAVAGLGVRASLPTVVGTEATLVHVEEFDVFHGASAICPGGVTVVPALVVGALLGRSGAEVIDAVHLGAEVVIDVATSMGGAGLYARRYWPSATFGAIGAAVTVGELLNLNEEAIVAAMAIAACQAGGLLSVQDRFEGHYLLYGRAAWTGAEAAMLAGNGARGDRMVLDSVADAAFGGPPQVAERAAHLAGLTFKPYPVARPLHAAIEALLLLAVENHLKATDISSAVLGVPSATIAILNTDPVPTSTDQAVCSAPFVLSAALAGVADLPDTYRSDSLGGWVPEFPVRLEGSTAHDLTYPEHWGATLTLELANGQVLTRRVVDGLGGPTRPLPEADLVRKFELQAQPVLGAEGSDECLGLLLELSAVADVGDVRAVLAGAARPSVGTRSIVSHLSPHHVEHSRLTSHSNKEYLQ